MVLAGIPAGEIFPNAALEGRVADKAPVGFSVEVCHPAHFIFRRQFTGMELLVIAHPLDHVQANIPDVICPDNLLPICFENVADSTTQDHVAQVPDMQWLVGIGVGIFHHYGFALHALVGKLIALAEHGPNDPFSICVGLKIKVKIAARSFHPAETRWQTEVSFQAFSQLLRMLGDGELPVWVGSSQGE